MLVQPSSERIVLPFTKNLSRLGIDVNVRTVDSAQYQKRVQDFDFDMIISLWAQSQSPGNEQRDFWASAAADRPGSRNLAGLKDPVVDELTETLIAAPDRESLVTATHALDRVLLWKFFVIPQFYNSVDRVAYWDKFGRPEITPKSGVAFSTWWVVPDKAKTVKEAQPASGGK
jgi:microcin C transport system substrate-binding protein